MKTLVAFLFLAGLVFTGCESQRTTTENYGYGMEFTSDSDSNEAKVID